MSVGILGKFFKQPSEVKDYNFDFTDFLTDKNDTIATAIVTAPAGLTVNSYSHVGGVVKAFVSGGTDGTSYTLRCLMVTTGGRTEEAEITIRVKETT